MSRVGGCVWEANERICGEEVTNAVGVAISV